MAGRVGDADYSGDLPGAGHVVSLWRTPAERTGRAVGAHTLVGGARRVRVEGNEIAVYRFAGKRNAEVRFWRARNVDDMNPAVAECCPAMAGAFEPGASTTLTFLAQGGLKPLATALLNGFARVNESGPGGTCAAKDLVDLAMSPTATSLWTSSA